MSGGKNRDEKPVAAPAPAGEPTLAAIHSDLAAIGAGVLSTADVVGSLAGTMTTTLDAIGQLHSKLSELQGELTELRAMTKSLVVQRPRNLTVDEVRQLVETKPGQVFLVTEPYPVAGLNPGDRFEARLRFQQPADLPLHVERGLKLTIPPQTQA